MVDAGDGCPDLPSRYPDFHRDLIDLSLDLVSVLDDAGVVVYECPAVESLLGYRLGERLGHPVLDYVHPDDRPRAAEALARVVDGERSTDSVEIRLQRADGSWRDLETVGRRWLLDERVYVLLNTRDITDRRNALRALAQSNELLTKTLRASRNIVCITDADSGEYVDVNEEWLRVSGFRREEVIGRSGQQLGLWGEPGNRDRGMADLGSAGGCLRDYEITVYTRNGARQLIVNVESLVISERPMVLMIGADVTDARLTEEKLRQAQKMEAVGQLTGGVAHDFNNLLGVIIGNAELLQSAVAGEERLSRLVTPILQASERGATLTRQLLAFSRRQVLAPQPVDLEDVIGRMMPLLRTTVGPNVKLTLQVDPALWVSQVDPAQLENAVLNLVLNARDAMPDGGRLEVTLANRTVADPEARDRDITSGDYLALCLTDSGIGMEPAVRDRIFDPFFTTKRAGQGTGLGLSMVFGFARQSGGQVSIASSPGAGTRATLLLPRASDAAATVAEDATALPRGRGETVLVIDDEPGLLELLEVFLDELGYRVLTARDETAVAALLDQGVQFDLLVSDVLLSGARQGPEVAAGVLARRPEVAVLYMSGYPAREVQGNLPGSRQPLLRKPFTRRDLARRVRDALGS